MTGLVPETDPMIIECFQDAENNHVIVKAYCSSHLDDKDWLQPVFDKFWQDVANRFLSETISLPTHTKQQTIDFPVTQAL